MYDLLLCKYFLVFENEIVLLIISDLKTNELDLCFM